MRHEDSAADPLPPLAQVVRRHGLEAHRALGQHFLRDMSLAHRIARAGDPAGRTVLEIGPGPGALTRALLLQGARKVIAVERDARFLPILAEIAAAFPGRLCAVHADALDYAPPATGPVRVIANLPYNIATALLGRWLSGETWPPWHDGLVVMLQKDVALRVAAPPGSRARGRLSVLCQWRSTARLLFDIAPAAFVPPPKVTSSLVSISPAPGAGQPGSGEPGPDAMKQVTAAAFGQRRKMLRGALKSLAADPLPLLAAAGISPTARAETLCVDDFRRLALAFEQTSSAA